MRTSQLVLVLLILLPNVEVLAENKVLELTVALNSVTLKKYQHYLEHGDICKRISQYEEVQLDRGLVELILMCEALLEAGFNADIRVISAPNYARALRMVDIGQVDTLAESVWSQDSIRESTYVSAELIRYGEFEKGVYVKHGHALLASDPDHLDLSSYRGITFKSWFFDWKIMGLLTPEPIPIVQLSSLFKMLAADRADFTLLEFPAKNTFDIIQDGLLLKPILGVKVLIPDSRRFIVSKKTLDGKTIFKALELGLVKLREKNRIRETYIKFGFINKRTEHWRILNDDTLVEYFDVKSSNEK